MTNDRLRSTWAARRGPQPSSIALPPPLAPLRPPSSPPLPASTETGSAPHSPDPPRRRGFFLDRTSGPSTSPPSRRRGLSLERPSQPSPTAAPPSNGKGVKRVWNWVRRHMGRRSAQ